MKRDMTKLENIKEEDLNDVNKVNNAPEIDEKPPGDIPQQALDDTRRVKIISPGLLVAKRFFRNKLAIVGLSLLIFMFGFCFLGGWIIPYNQKEVFYKYDFILFDYGTATERVSYENYLLPDSPEIHYSVRHRMNTYISQMGESSLTELAVTDTTEDANAYIVRKLNDEIFTLNYEDIEQVATYQNQLFFADYDTQTDTLSTEEVIGNETLFKSLISAAIPAPMTFSYSGDDFLIRKGSTKNGYKVYKELADGVFEYGGDPLGSEFENALKSNLTNESFLVSGRTFILSSDGLGTYTISEDFGEKVSLFSSTLVFDRYDIEGPDISSAFKLAAFDAIGNNITPFSFEGKTYSLETDLDDGRIIISDTSETDPVPYVKTNTFVVRRYNGEDSLSMDFKQKVNIAVDEMKDNSITKTDFTYYMELLDEEGNPQLDEEGAPVYGESAFIMERKLDNFVLRNYQEKYLIDIYGAPSSQHLLGTDSNGMDVLTRMMYGGRISLIIGFVVIFLSIFLGVIMGGIAGYFGKWIDNLIMRLVDIFYCIPTMPILIIMGALFDSLRIDPYVRIMYLMIMLGVLGWSGIARLVRGQILSLREQEFMLATEATGLKASRRIFRHLVPNVMPQLIVNATMGLGGIILTESTLSFLGLGAKYPLATWGAMINSVSTASAMVAYTYIWIPVGLLICLTVIAFNFVGDGLRDAFDPKMKR
ncbi:MAG: Oligopeptide transport system permease protein OppC [Firmicutes bacterium ADurb.Bin080]|nr:MAG: Oligopeptide transport system permease protein OppC [Firmicutes bacterium ADurb.Bin080]